jgi:hypothetical protein
MPPGYAVGSDRVLVLVLLAIELCELRIDVVLLLLALRFA